MCGIAGIIGIKPSQNILSIMAQAMIHRGPDDEGFYLGIDVGFAFRRLSIVDIKDGHQPMTNEDGTIQVIFNGEIYNHIELRQQLIAKGHRFATDHSDTEVIVHGWKEWGTNLFNKLNGMFAIAIWDAKTKNFILARDRYGIKPVYFSHLTDGTLVFSSEIKPILASGLVEKKPCFTGILEYFSFQNLWRNFTMFEGIQQLEAGHYIQWQQRKISKFQYWDITFPRSRKDKFEDLVAEHQYLLKQAVNRHIAADVPVMSYLSGGIDSSAITMLAHQQDPTIRAYSCIFDLTDVTDDKICDEREFSRLIAQTYNIDRVELELNAQSLSKCLDDYVYSLEDLRMGMGYVNYLIAKRVSQDAKVVLSGTGGDEFHAGYIGRYQALGLTQTQSKPNLRNYLRNMYHQLAVNAKHGGKKKRYKKMLNVLFTKDQLSNVFTKNFLNAAGDFDANNIVSEFINRCPSSDWRDRVLYVDAKTYLTGLLVFEDKVSMAHSLEARVPLLDNELIDFVLDVPFDALCRNDIGKVIFRESVKPFVPSDIYSKPKMGFGPPDASWYRNGLRAWIEGQLHQDLIKKTGVFQSQFVHSTLADHFSGVRNNTYLIWSLLNFQSWCKSFNFFQD
ncbi:asparagine synthase (glutamine-hydrolyzing) [soil metagenome]